MSGKGYRLKRDTGVLERGLGSVGGHTLGHAVESLQRYRGALHGEAVAMGMVYAAQRSIDLGLAPPRTRPRLEAVIRRAGLPTELPGFSRKAYLSGG